MRPAFVFAALALSNLAGCAPPQQAMPYIITEPFDESKLAWSTKPGDASIGGQAFLKTRGGDVKTCAGNTVQLVPVSPYTNQMRSADLAGLVDAGWANKHPGLNRYVRNTTCDAQGRFAFRSLPPGDWHLRTVVTWEAPTGSGLSTQGGAVRYAMATKPGEQAEVVMNGR